MPDEPHPTPTLYLVATPIGNLDDITLRGIAVLRQVDLIASEDTRKTGRLLKHLEIATPQISYHDHNKDSAGPHIVARLLAGQSVALVTNAGTPCIADPGFALVRRALADDIAVTGIPGPTALVTALSLSGLPVHSFTFRGFLPRKTAARRRYLTEDLESPHTLIYYESPYRVAAALEDAVGVFGDRRAALANDLTKLYERVWRGTLSEILGDVSSVRLRGEFVLLVAGKET